MNFKLSEEHLMIKNSAREFTKKHLLPDVIERDNEQRFPTTQVKEMGAMGFMGMMVDTKFDGGGLDTLSYVLVVEEIAKVDASAAVILSVNNSLVNWGLDKFGTEEQKNKYLRPLARGDKIGAFCLSEPEAGSDAKSQKTRAEDQGDHYVINGIKNWITNGNSASTYLVFAQTNPEKGYKGICVFIVERAMEGLEIGKKEDKLGIRSSDTHSLIFTNVKVPKKNIIGSDEGFGFKFAMRSLFGGRIGIAAQALGIATGAFELSVKYAKERKTFGRPIIEHQAIAFKLAEMAAQIESARYLVYKAACDKDLGLDYNDSSAKAKLLASKIAMDTTIDAVQIHGGNGYVKEYHVERMMRDAKVTQIYEGTSEVQKIVISRLFSKT